MVDIIMVTRRDVLKGGAAMMGAAILGACDGVWQPQSVAYIGASLTCRPVRGYHELGSSSNQLWPYYETGGGTVVEWIAPGSQYWLAFDQMHAANPIQRVWVMLCTRDDDYGGDLGLLRQQARTWLRQLRTRTDAPVYFSSMFEYLDQSCSSVTRSVGDTATIRDELVAAGTVLPGPVLAPLDSTQLANGRCDQNELGQEVHGRQLQAFFG